MAPSTHIITRPKNKDAHPKMVAYDSDTECLPIPKARKAQCSAAEMKEDRAAKLAQKAADEMQRKKAIQKVAQIENEMAAAEEENHQTAARPPAKCATKVTRKTIAASSEDESDTGTCRVLFPCLYTLTTSYQAENLPSNSAKQSPNMDR